MGKKDKDKPNPNSPFKDLAGLRDRLAGEEAAKTARKAAEEARRKAAAAAAAAATAKAREETELFAEAMAGVKPLGEAPVRPRKKPPEGPPVSHDDENEQVLFELQGMVDGTIPLDFTDSGEFVEGRALDCAHVELAKLREGLLAVEGQIDLHGMNREEARAALEKFFRESIKRGHRCVNVICGRGLGSPGGKPVLKELLTRWFVQGQLSYNILAFSSAKRHDGGVGAIYVLLRRNPRR